MFVGADTHYLSKLAFETVLSVLAANKVTAYVDADGDFVPTPSVSRAILRFNDHRKEHVADGLILTPSHNPPEHGGIKYNPTTGGPAGSEMTKAIETEANRLLAGHNKDVQMIPYEEAAQSDFVVLMIITDYMWLNWRPSSIWKLSAMPICPFWSMPSAVRA